MTDIATTAPDPASPRVPGWQLPFRRGADLLRQTEVGGGRRGGRVRHADHHAQIRRFHGVPVLEIPITEVAAH